MKTFLKGFLAVTVIGVGVALCAPSPGASSENFVVTNNNHISGNNAGTVWKLIPGVDPSLSVAASLPTGGFSADLPSAGMNEIAIIRHGSDVCVFISDHESGDIASFLVPDYAEVGRFTLPGIANSTTGIGLAARQDFLFANYFQYSNGAIYIATWRIRSGCVLDLVSTFQPAGFIYGMAISPDSKTLIVSYGNPPGTVDSFSVGPDGSLTEHGPYNYYALYLNATGIDITEDSKYALIGEIGYGVPPNNKPYTEVGIYPINSDGSLGTDLDFGGAEGGGLGPGVASSWVRLSPDEKFLFVSGTSYPGSVTTLTFNESVPSVEFSCIVKQTNPMHILTLGLTTILSTGSGGYLAQSEVGFMTAALGLFSVDSSTGCLTQVPGSPYLVGRNSGLGSMASWPPRPF